MRTLILLLSLLVWLPAPARAQDAEAPLVVLPGAEAGALRVQSQCVVCHAIGHTTRSRLSRGEWEDTLDMMRKRGAQFSADDAKVMIDYLALHYGPAGPPAAARPLARAVTSGAAVDPKLLLDQHGCSGCHATEQRVVGPSFREISARYRGDAAAPARLAQNIRQGGVGNWGQVPMPAMSQVPAADIEALVAFALRAP